MSGLDYDTSLPEMNEYLFDVLDQALPKGSPLRQNIRIADPKGGSCERRPKLPQHPQLAVGRDLRRALTVALYAVTTIGLNETYQLPPIGSTSARAAVSTHDDSMTLSGVLVGADRYRRKVELELLAESSKRGSALASLSGGRLTGLIVVTAMTIRTDMQVQTLGFTASSGKRDALDVSISLAHMPLPGSLGDAAGRAPPGRGDPRTTWALCARCRGWWRDDGRPDRRLPRPGRPGAARPRR